MQNAEKDALQCLQVVQAALSIMGMSGFSYSWNRKVELNHQYSHKYRLWQCHWWPRVMPILILYWYSCCYSRYSKENKKTKPTSPVEAFLRLHLQTMIILTAANLRNRLIPTQFHNTATNSSLPFPCPKQKVVFTFLL